MINVWCLETAQHYQPHDNTTTAAAVAAVQQQHLQNEIQSLYAYIHTLQGYTCQTVQRLEQQNHAQQMQAMTSSHTIQSLEQQIATQGEQIQALTAKIALYRGDFQAIEHTQYALHSVEECFTLQSELHQALGHCHDHMMVCAILLVIASYS